MYSKAVKICHYYYIFLKMNLTFLIQNILHLRAFYAICSFQLKKTVLRELPNFLETFLFVDRSEQNLHCICQMKNKIYFAYDIFRVYFFLVFLLFTILWTNSNKIIFTQSPKALSVLVLGKKKTVFWKAR